MKTLSMILPFFAVFAVSGFAKAEEAQKVAKKTMLNTGKFLVQCQDGSVESGITPFQYFAGDVCPSEAKNDIPVAVAQGLMTLGSCSADSVNTEKGFEMDFAEPYFGLVQGSEQDSTQCLIVLKYKLPAGLKISFGKVRFAFKESKVAEDSDVRVEMSADGDARVKQKVSAKEGKATVDYSFDVAASTPCYTKPNSVTRVNLHVAIFGDKISKNDSIKVETISIPDFKVVKCAE